MLLDEALAEWDFRSAHARDVRASPERAMAAALDLRSRDLLLTRVLMAIRTLPGRLLDRRAPLAARGPVFDQMVSEGFAVLARDEREIVLGAVGRFWEPRSRPFPLAGVDDFRAFVEPGCAKAAMNLRVLDTPGGARIATETRVAATDERARRTFSRYWLAIGPGSGLIRHEMLAAIGRRAERGA
jgi:hypothetical protein